MFSSFRGLSVLATWNSDAARPDSLVGDPANVHFLQDTLLNVDGDPPDIISFGFQAVIDVESRKMAAKNVLLGSSSSLSSSKRKQEESGITTTAATTRGGLSAKVTSAYKR